MRQWFLKSAAMIIAVVFLSLHVVLAEEPTEIDWDKFSKSLVKALQSNNEGVQLSAMQLVIKYGDKVDVSAARYRVMDIFMKHKDQKVRQLALVTSYVIHNPFDLGLLERQLKFEEDAVIARQIAAIMVDSNRLSAVKNYYAYEPLASIDFP